MFQRFKNLFQRCFSLILIFCVLIGLRTNIFGNSEVHFGPAVWFKQSSYPNLDETLQSSMNFSKTGKGPNTKIAKEQKPSTSGSHSLNDTELKNVQDIHVIKKYYPKVHITNVVARLGHASLDGSVNCSKKEINLSQTLLPITGLVSFPGSGNTWTRHLIQQMTGIGTSSMYCDEELRARGFPYECHHNRARTVVVKTHEARHFNLFKNIVLLLRNPYDALLSCVNFAKVGHTGHSSKQVLIQALTKTFEHYLRWYVNLTKSIIEKFKGPVHVVQYERLQSDMAGELRKLASFFNLSVPDKDIDCTVKLQEGNFHRKTSEADHIELLNTVYTKENLLRLQEAARYSEKLLRNAYNVDIDLGGTTERLLFQTS
ncbi:WSCD family member AGAP003962-like [Mercenaria mercenaria]|uniref:WSCD family member AGAP003962-like n=1 Tax=Mercenaria mercenaria TaxID=6596 RepID=UPI00234FA7D2|nr:WSCD family member AGAP003962-like [Mercenaria mercenaria]